MKKNKISLYLAIAFIIFVIALFTVKLIHKNNDLNQNEVNNIAEENQVVDKDISENITETNIIDEAITNKINNENTAEKDISNNIVNNNVETKVTESKNDTPKQEVQNNVTSTFNESYFTNGHLENYPAFGDNYGTLIINKIGVNAPIIFGANDETILKGVGHDSGSYFPGEGGSIIMCEHNYMNNFAKLGELQNGDIIEVKTEYGDFYYKKYDEQIVMETEYGKLPIQEEKEILMIYTCYPFKGTERTQYRYVIYAEKI